MKTEDRLSHDLKAKAGDLGFDFVGICSTGPGDAGAAAYTEWLAAGMHADMSYMARPDRVRRTLDPAGSLPAPESLVVVASNYFVGDLPPAWRDDPARGIFASYAWDLDYHDVMTPRLEALGEWLRAQGGASGRTRVYVDTGPVLERDAALRAGLGFFGKNTMLIRPGVGAWLFLGVLMTDVRLERDPPFEGGTCGHCTRCMVACPTDAFPSPWILDARRCISYLTIEHRGPIPRALRSGIGNRIFGCDICNEVCPYNRRAARAAGDQPPLAASVVAPPLLELVALDEAAFRTRYARSPVMRTGRVGLVRNVCVALGNWGSPQAVPALIDALHDAEPIVRGHAAWALGRVDLPGAHAALERARRRELDPYVQAELASALEGAAPRNTRRTRSTSPASDDGNIAGRPAATDA